MFWISSATIQLLIPVEIVSPQTSSWGLCVLSLVAFVHLGQHIPCPLPSLAFPSVVSHFNLVCRIPPWSNHSVVADPPVLPWYNSSSFLMKRAAPRLAPIFMPSAVFEPASNSLDGLNIVIDPTGLYETISDSSEGQSKRSSPTSLARRRSVSSMKGLMPLTLSPTSAQSSTHLHSNDNMDERDRDYFPELLARDLEVSNDVFAARRMTAGVPSSSLAAEYRAKMRANGTMTNTAARAFSPYHTASARVKLLGAIEERDCIPSFLDHQDPVNMDTASDLDSLCDSQESGGMPPPDFRYRNHSIVTTATSLASSNLIPSPKPSPPPAPIQEDCSWIAAESDVDDDMDQESHADYSMEPLSPLSPRPRTQESKFPGVKPKAQVKPEPWRSTPFLHRKSHSVSGGSPIASPRRKAAEQSMSSIGTKDAIPFQFKDEPIFGLQPRHQASSASFNSLHRPITNQSHAQAVHFTTQNSHNNRSSSSKLPVSRRMNEEDTDMDDYDDEYEQSLYSARPSVQPPRDTVYIQPSPPPSPLPSVQSWLNSSLQPYPSNYMANDDLAKVVPLPPNVIETLRVNVACFPETMLLSSSLTIDTIRSYAKKVRQPGMNLKALEPSPPPSPTYSGRKSLWRKVVSHKKTTQTPESKPSSLYHSNDSRVQTSSGLAAANSKLWLPLKNVFGNCSDYVCDALYAHLVAYNYISALVARLPPPPQPARQRSFNSHTESHQDDVPKKAAMLLGLGGNAEAIPDRMSRLSKRVSSQMTPWGREEMVVNQSTQSTGQDNAIRSVQSGLLKCIARLIATAKLMSENKDGHNDVLDMDKEDHDMLLMRSLCEIVRMTEESH